MQLSQVIPWSDFCLLDTCGSAGRPPGWGRCVPRGSALQSPPVELGQLFLSTLLGIYFPWSISFQLGLSLDQGLPGAQQLPTDKAIFPEEQLLRVPATCLGCTRGAEVGRDG